MPGRRTGRGGVKSGAAPSAWARRNRDLFGRAVADRQVNASGLTSRFEDLEHGIHDADDEPCGLTMSPTIVIERSVAALQDPKFHGREVWASSITM